jgi:hypothetical protein
MGQALLRAGFASVVAIAFLLPIPVRAAPEGNSDVAIDVSTLPPVCYSSTMPIPPILPSSPPAALEPTRCWARLYLPMVVSRMNTTSMARKLKYWNHPLASTP